jgi:hypothetical protein
MRSVKYSVFLFLIFALGCDDQAANELASTGQGGSMTRFAIYDNNLYAVSNEVLVVYDIAAGGFEKVNEVQIGWSIETLFAKYPYLYIGSAEAMYIYSIADPHSPEYVFRYAHITSCDPVVVQGNRAYVTLRGGTACNAGANALEILDISDPDNTTLVANYNMLSPYGLGVNGNFLFLCEGVNGFKVFDIANETDIQLLKHTTDFAAYDVIVRDTWIAVTGQDGIYQFQYPDQDKVISLLSQIPVLRD